MWNSVASVGPLCNPEQHCVVRVLQPPREPGVHMMPHLDAQPDLTAGSTGFHTRRGLWWLPWASLACLPGLLVGGVGFVEGGRGSA